METLQSAGRIFEMGILVAELGAEFPWSKSELHRADKIGASRALVAKGQKLSESRRICWRFAGG